MSKKILVLDDEADTLKLLCLRLKKNGYEAIPCKNGKEALKKAREIIPDLAVLDIKLPDMDGYDVLSKMRAFPLLKKMPAIFSTADASVALKETAFDYQANDYVIKPYDSSQLLKKIEFLLR